MIGFYFTVAYIFQSEIIVFFPYFCGNLYVLNNFILVIYLNTVNQKPLMNVDFTKYKNLKLKGLRNKWKGVQLITLKTITILLVYW